MKKILALMVLAGGSLFAAPGVFVGVHIGGGPRYYAPPPPPPVVAYRPAYPGPGYSWIGGYYVPVGGRYAWHNGYWGRPPYAHATWVGPRYERSYRPGYWRR
jgi:hypothetical protein